ncbi:MAG: ABC transporter ATP-binding protein [Chloroflexi bacterium]|nr:ABC transporter ATP-binding protein [Chloroflexota bacterium]
MTNALEIQGLSKNFGAVKAVDKINVTVRRGEIYAFLGLNGAGKTTTIRALLGMIRPSEGNIIVLDQPLGQDGSGPWAKVGHLVESPSAYPELTVRENLEIARRLHGIRNPKVVDEAMDHLSIALYADRKAGTLSSGNLQRLGLARALLHEPELIILDEPANGLDPAGVVEIREMLSSLAHERGMTVFMSSHILSEVDLLATRIGIIHKGRMIEELDANKLEQLRSRRLDIKTRDNKFASEVLKRAGYSLKIEAETLVILEQHALDAPDIIATLLVSAGVSPTHLAVKQENLEDYFLRLTGENQ